METSPIIWHEDRALLFASAPQPGYAATTYRRADDLHPAKLLQIFDNSNRLCVVADDPQEALAAFGAFLLPVDAAGGVVRDAEGRLLAMRRRGRWDLPKGHVEAGEDFAEAAVREVAEETGVQAAIVSQLCDTFHFYDTFGRWELKRTRWFAMTCTGNGRTVPQTEEDITDTVWLTSGEWTSAMRTSFGTIREVAGAYLANPQ